MMHRLSRVSLSLLLLMPLLAACSLTTHLVPFTNRSDSAAVVKGVAWSDASQFWQDSDGGYNWHGIESDLVDMTTAGITWARVDLYPGTPLAFYVRLALLAQAHGVNVVFIVWGRDQPPDDLGSDRDRANYRTWLGRVVAQLKEDVHYWEIDNEEDISQFWNIDDGTTNEADYDAAVHRYVLHLEDSYETIKGTDPSATVILGGLSEWHAERYLARLIAEHADRWFDVAAYHPYANTPSAVVARLQALKAAVAGDPAFADKPIWITEIGFPCQKGWSDFHTTCSEQAKATYLVQTMTGLARAGITTPIFWYELHEAPNSDGYGLVGKDKATLQSTYLPAFNAYKDLRRAAFAAVTGSRGASGQTAERAGALPASSAANDPVVLAAGDVADCSYPGDSATARLVGAYPEATILMLGDAVYNAGTPAEFAACYNPTWGQFKSRTDPTPGNHEYLTPGAAGYFQYFGPAAGEPGKGYYSFDLGAWHLIVLNGNCTYVGGCGLGSPQERWLRADLAAHPSLCTLAYWHQPRFSSGAVEGSNPAYDAFWQDLYNAGADLVLNGHSHDYERFAPQDPSGKADPQFGIREIIVGTGGKDLDRFATVQSNSQVRSDSTFGVLKLTLHADSYDWQFLPTPGSSFSDAGHAVCHP